VDAAQAGSYLVTWQVISQDTHPVHGRFAFSVGHASAVPGAPALGASDLGGVAPLGLALQVLARWLHFAGYALGFGPVAFSLLVLRRRAAGPMDRVERRLWRLVGVGIAALLLAEPVALLAQTASLGVAETFDAGLILQTLASSFGRVLAQRAGAAVGLWVLAGAASGATHAAPDGRGSRPAAVGAAGLGLALAVIDGQASHAAGAGPPWLGLGINALHVMAMGAWVGGLFALLAIWTMPDLEGQRGVVAERFGRLAAASLLVLAATGQAMAVLYLTRPADLITTPYGRALLAKSAVLLVAVLLAVAGTRPGQADRQLWWRREAVALLVLLVLAGLLVSLPPPV
jgi:copper transport protein